MYVCLLLLKYIRQISLDEVNELISHHLILLAILYSLSLDLGKNFPLWKFESNFHLLLAIIKLRESEF